MRGNNYYTRRIDFLLMIKLPVRLLFERKLLQKTEIGERRRDTFLKFYDTIQKFVLCGVSSLNLNLIFLFRVSIKLIQLTQGN